MKNQISIEYLSTFGWILLVVLVTILTLSYFGVFDISNQIPKKCNFGEQIDCNNQFIDSNGNFVVSLTSRFNKQIEIKSFDLDNYLIDINNCSSTILVPGRETNIICSMTDLGGNQVLFDDDRQSFDVTLTIEPLGTTDSYEIDGNIFTDIIDADVSVAFSCTGLGGQETCDQAFMCEGSIISSNDYLGQGYCCIGTCVQNYCEDVNQGNGTCCGSCDGLRIPGTQFRSACENTYGAQKSTCCKTGCAEDEDDELIEEGSGLGGG